MPKLVIYNDVLKTSSVLDVEFSADFLAKFIDADLDDKKEMLYNFIDEMELTEHEETLLKIFIRDLLDEHIVFGIT